MTDTTDLDISERWHTHVSRWLAHQILGASWKGLTLCASCWDRQAYSRAARAFVVVINFIWVWEPGHCAKTHAREMRRYAIFLDNKERQR